MTKPLRRVLCPKVKVYLTEEREKDVELLMNATIAQMKKLDKDGNPLVRAPKRCKFTNEYFKLQPKGRQAIERLIRRWVVVVKR